MDFKTYYKKNFKSKNEAAKVLQISRPYVYKLLAGERVGLSTALRIEKITKRKLRAIKLMGLE